VRVQCPINKYSVIILAAQWRQGKIWRGKTTATCNLALREPNFPLIGADTGLYKIKNSAYFSGLYCRIGAFSPS